jgi:hypothetical protein
MFTGKLSGFSSETTPLDIRPKESISVIEEMSLEVLQRLSYNRKIYPSVSARFGHLKESMGSRTHENDVLV